MGSGQLVDLFAGHDRVIREQSPQPLFAPLGDPDLHYQAPKNELAGKVEPMVGQGVDDVAPDAGPRAD